MKNAVVRYAREGVAVLFWLYVLFKIFVFDVDVYLIERFAPSLSWLLAYKLVGIMVALAALWIALGHLAFFLFLVYVITYPAVWIFRRIAKLATGQWPLLVLFTPVLHSAIQRARSTFALYTLAIICSLVIAVQSSKVLLALSMLGLAVFLSVHLFRSLRTAYSTRVFYQLAEFTRVLRGAVQSGRIDGTTDMPQSTGAATSASIPAGTGRMNLYAFHTFADVVAVRINDLVKRRVFDLYLIASWLYTVIVTVLVYGLEYWAVHLMDISSFKGADDAGFWDFAGFSFGMLTTATLSRIEATSRISILISYSEVACGLIILVILVFSILTAAREAFREDVLEFTSELRMTAAAAESRVSALYQLTLAQLELVLLDENGAFVNSLRKARGLPALPVPKKNATPAAPPVIEGDGSQK